MQERHGFCRGRHPLFHSQLRRTSQRSERELRNDTNHQHWYRVFIHEESWTSQMEYWPHLMTSRGFPFPFQQLNVENGSRPGFIYSLSCARSAGRQTERKTPSVAKIKTYLLNGLKPAPAERKWLSRMHGASWLN